MNEINKIKTNTAKDGRRTAGDERAGTPSRLRSLASRRKSPSFSSDSSLSSDSDVERSGQRSNGPRHRRGYLPSNRTKEYSGSAAVSRQRGERAKKTVSWNESLRANTPTDLNRQINPNEKPRIPPKPPVRTVSRDGGAVRTASRESGAERTMSRETRAITTALQNSGAERSRDSGAVRTLLPDSVTERTLLRDSSPGRTVLPNSGSERAVPHVSGAVRTMLRDSGTVGYAQVSRNPPRNRVSRRVDDVVVRSVTVQQPVTPIAVSRLTTNLFQLYHVLSNISIVKLSFGE